MTIDTQKLREWTRYSTERPTEAGIYEWRVPSKAVPGMVLIVAAKMRARGAGFETVLSPEFDYWDGYRVHVLCDVEWRRTEFVPGKHQLTPAVLCIEGLELSPCSHCGKVPSIEAHQRDSYGIAICPDPWKLNSWQFNCCAWGETPRMNDPREIERIRRETRRRGDAQAAEIARLRGLIAEMADNNAYETEYDGRMYSICHGCGAQDGEDHRRADCVYVRAAAALSGESHG